MEEFCCMKCLYIKDGKKKIEVVLSFIEAHKVRAFPRDSLKSFMISLKSQP